MSIEPKPFISPEEYLRREKEAPFRSEYYRGEIFAMAGASPGHYTLASNIHGELFARTKEGPCRVFVSDVKVQVRAGEAYVYPDVTGLCVEPVYAAQDQTVLTNPSFVIEILSPSTEKYDRDLKFTLYEAVPSIQEYILVSQEYRLVHQYTREPGGTWSLHMYSRETESVRFKALNCEVPLTDIYRRVAVPENLPLPPVQ